MMVVQRLADGLHAGAGSGVGANNRDAVPALPVAVYDAPREGSAALPVKMRGKKL